MRTGTIPAGRREAWDALIAPIKAPLAVPPGAPANFPVRVSFIANVVFSRLFLPVARTSPFPGHPPLPPIAAPPLHASLVPSAAVELGLNLIDADKLRSFAVRRLSADILKRMQRIEALSVLTDARNIIAAEIPTLTGARALETRDLLSRVEKHLVAYFD